MNTSQLGQRKEWKSLKVLKKRRERKPHKYDPAPPNPWDLSDAEYQCILWLIEGLTMTEVARKIFISQKTLATYLGRAKEKMKASTTVLAALMLDRRIRQVQTPDLQVVLTLKNGVPSVEMFQQ